MKRNTLLTLMLCGTMIFSLSACTGNSPAAETKTAETTISETAAAGSTAAINDGETTEADDENTQIANPFIDCDTLNDASKAAGFTMIAPDSLDGYPDKIITAIENEMIDVYFSNDTDSVLFRKGVGTDDISGDYNEYSDVVDVTVNDRTVTLKGEGGTYSDAIWNDGTNCYAVVCSTPVDQDTLMGYAGEMMCK